MAEVTDRHALCSRRRAARRERGQGMTEYIIIVALVAIGAIFVVTVFGDNIRALFGASANALVGAEGSPEDLGGRTVEQGQVQRDLQNFSEAP